MRARGSAAVGQGGRRRSPAAALLACGLIVGLLLAGCGAGTRRGTPERSRSPAPRLGATGSGPAGPAEPAWQTLQNPIDPRQLTELAFCDRSFWLQPWRAYLDTPTASTLANAISVNLNVAPSAVTRTADLLGGRGIHRVRLELPWDLMSYAHPNELSDPAALRDELRELRAAHIRPLILLNANQVAPGPLQRLTLHLTLPAIAGARTIFLRRSDVAEVVPGLTGLDTAQTAAGDLITSVTPGGRATLSRPLPLLVAAGPVAASTLRYPPFAAPQTASGAANPSFEDTLGGWLGYVSAITGLARQVLGPDGFDVEVWNELSFGSAFLSAANYYDPVPAALGGTGDPDSALLDATIAWIRNPAHGVARIGIGDGFSDETPFAAGSTAPPGLTALDKHPYMGARTIFGAGTAALPCLPIDADGQPDGRQVGSNRFLDDFTPSFVDYFPEYFLNALQTETLVRDLAPITTTIAGVAHGIDTHSPGAVPPQVWITETGLDESQIPGLTPAALRHVQAKTALRYLVAYVGTGASLVDLYTAAGPNFGIIQPSFFSAPRTGAAVDGDGGPTVDAIGRLAAALRGGRITHRRSLQLLSLATQSSGVQFLGDGNPATPTLTNLDATAVFPFQAAEHRFVIAAYVMTRDVAQLYDPSAPADDVDRYDLPAAPYRITLGGIDGRLARATATDPLLGTSVPVQIAARGRDTVTLQLPLTDSPRLISLTDG